MNIPSARVESEADTPAARLGCRIERLVLRRISLPLHRPFSPSYGTFHEFEPTLVETHLDNGSIGWGEGHIVPGSSSETRQGGWQAVCAWAREVVGAPCGSAVRTVTADRRRSPVAATALVTSIEMAAGDPLLTARRAARIPLLVPISSHGGQELADEVEASLEAGFLTFKVKVGRDVEQSLKRVQAVQAATRGRAVLRLDANRGFTRDQGIAFASQLDPAGIELFEQPCHAEAWDDNAAVAAASPVPLMLDESICSIADIERAAGLPGIAFCKLKLKRFGSVGALRDALQAVSDRSMGAVLGDGLSTDLACWMEACAGADLMHGAGEFNGFLKPRISLMTPALTCRSGHLVLDGGAPPVFDAERVQDRILETQTILPS